MRISGFGYYWVFGFVITQIMRLGPRNEDLRRHESACFIKFSIVLLLLIQKTHVLY